MARRHRTFLTNGFDPRMTEPRKVQSVKFPLFLLLLAIISLSGTFYFLLVKCPLAVFALGQDEGMFSHLFNWIEKLVVALGSQPALAFGLFVALLLPGLLNFQRARPYFLSLIFCCFIIGGFTFTFIKNPADDFGVTLHSLLDESKRDLPSGT